MLLGVTAQAAYADAEVELEPGDVVVIYTDGLSEARRGDELFGTRRLREVVEAHAHRGASDLLHALLEAAQAFADQPLDDVTVVVLKQRARVPARAGADPSQIALKLEGSAADPTR